MNPPFYHGAIKEGYAEGPWWISDYGWVHYERGLAQGAFAASNAGYTLTGAHLDGHPHGRWVLQTPEAVYAACYEGRGGLVVDPPRVITPHGTLPPCPPADHIDGPFQSYASDGSLIASGAYRGGVPYGLWDAPRLDRAPNLKDKDLEARWRVSGSFDQGVMQGRWLWTDMRRGQTHHRAEGEMVHGRRSGSWQDTSDTSTIRLRITPAEGGWEIEETLGADGAVTKAVCQHERVHTLARGPLSQSWAIEDAQELARPLPSCPRAEAGGSFVRSP